MQKNKLVLVWIQICCIPLFLQAQTIATKLLVDSLTNERGVAIDARDDVVYIISQDKDDKAMFLTKLNEDGDILYKTTLCSDNSTEARDLFIAQNGDVVCLYEQNRSVVINRIRPQGDLIWCQTIPITRPISFTCHIVELSDESIALVSPETYPDSFSTEQTAYITNLTHKGEFISKTRVDGASSFRIRDLSVVEDDHVLISAMGHDAPSVIAKVAPIDSSVIWVDTLHIEGTGFNRAYDAALLDDGTYGVVTNYSNYISDSLNGVYYFHLDTDGNVLNYKVFTGTFSAITYPRLIVTDEGCPVISYNIFQEDDMTKVRKIDIHNNGDIISDTLLSPNILYLFKREDVYLNAKILSIGSGTEYAGAPNGDPLFISISDNHCATTTQVATTNEGLDHVEIAPNPTRGTINFQLDNDYYGQVNCKIFDAVGNLKQMHSFNKINRMLKQQIELNNLSSGIYIVHFSSDVEFLTSKKIVVRK